MAQEWIIRLVPADDRDAKRVVLSRRDRDTGVETAYCVFFDMEGYADPEQSARELVAVLNAHISAADTKPEASDEA
jgi:hypothetical protein